MKNYKFICLILFLFIILSIVLATFIGSADINFSQVVAIYKYHIPFLTFLWMIWDCIVLYGILGFREPS